MRASSGGTETCEESSSTTGNSDGTTSLSDSRRGRKKQAMASPSYSATAAHRHTPSLRRTAFASQGVALPPGLEEPAFISIGPQKAVKQDAGLAGMPKHQARRAPPLPPWDMDRSVMLHAIKSLYDDRLRPLDHHVLRRIEEHTGRQWSLETLRTIAWTTPGVLVEDDTELTSRCWLYLKGKSRDFVDESSYEDPYPADIWDNLRVLIDRYGLQWSAMPVTSRYDFAWMLSKHLPALQPYKLGEVCHIVQLAVNLHRILGYRDGKLVPYRDSLEYERVKKAEQLRPTGSSTDEGYVESWEEARQKLDELLSSPCCTQGIPLSELKPKFHRHFGRDLNVTALGHTKLRALIEDPRVASVCRLEMHDSVRVVRHAATSSLTSSQLGQFYEISCGGGPEQLPRSVGTKSGPSRRRRNGRAACGGATAKTSSSAREVACMRDSAEPEDAKDSLPTDCAATSGLFTLCDTLVNAPNTELVQSLNANQGPSPLSSAAHPPPGVWSAARNMVFYACTPMFSWQPWHHAAQPPQASLT